MKRTAVVVCVVALIGLSVTPGVVPADAEPSGNYTLEFPHTSDHYPGDENPENASMYHFASVGQDLAEAEGAPEGFEVIHYVGIRNPEFDFSACNSDNTAVFGLDRGNNNSGTKTDEDLLEHRKDTKFGERELVVEFFTEDDFGGDAIDVRPEDAIVAVLGAGSSSGPCYTMPEEPGWYRLHGWANGTTPDGEFVEVDLYSNYQYICMCDNEAAAREELGPPPSEDGATPTPGDGTETPTGTSTPDNSTETPTATATVTPSEPATSTDGDATRTPAAGDTAETPTTGGDDGGEGDESAVDGGTPTVGEGAGFGPVVALAAVAIAVALRRWSRG